LKFKRHPSRAKKKSTVLDKGTMDDFDIDFDKAFEELGKGEPEVSRRDKALQEINEILKEQKNDMEEINALMIEKDREIERLRGSNPNPAEYEETRRILMLLDKFLEKLPEEDINKFAKSDEYLLYEKVLKRYNI
jgi:hypothetical protein